MKRLLLIIALGFCSSLFAIGLGIGYKAGYNFGQAYHDIDYYQQGQDRDYSMLRDHTSTQSGFEYFLDTNMFKNRVANARFKIGQMRYEWDFGGILPDGSDAKLTTNEMHFEVAFGVGLYRTKKIRFWAGPKFKYGITSFNEYEYTSFGNYDDSAVWDLDIVETSIGAVYAMNYRLYRFLALTTELSFLYTTQRGAFEVDWPNDDGFIYFRDDLSAHGYTIMLEIITVFTPWERWVE